MANTHTTFETLFTDIADAIRSKTGSTDKIVADSFPTAISEIKITNTGTDTSDATAESYEIAKGKTAYVKGEKLTGTAIVAEGNWLNEEVPVDSTTSFTAYKGGQTHILDSSNSSGIVQLSFNFGDSSEVELIVGINNDTKFNILSSYLAECINLTAAKLVKGNTVLGITGTADTGTNTSDATATATEIASGYTAYVKGSKITGTAELDPFAPYCNISGISTSNGNLNLYGGEYKQVFCEVNDLQVFSDLLQSDDYKDGGAWFFDISTGFFIQHQGTFGGRALFGVYNTSDTTKNFTGIDHLSLSTNGPMQPTKYPNAIMDLFTDENTKCFSNAEVVQNGTVIYLADNLVGSTPITVLFADSTSLTITIPKEVHQTVYDNGLSIYLVIPDVVKAAMKDYTNFLSNINDYNDVRFYGKSMIGIHTASSSSSDIAFDINIDAEDTAAMNASRWYILLTKNALI